MDFFEHQDQARRNTTLLIVWFGLAIVAMILIFYLIALFTFQDLSNGQLRLIQPGLLMLVSALVVGIIGFGTLTKMVELRRGGAAVAEGLGGRKLQPQTENLQETQLLNVVAEMALASGTPIPTVYLLEHETGINAFAAGYSPDDAVIGVTQGCLEQLNREELQGVIAHEFSHILNGDMRLNLKLMGVIQGLLFIYILGRVVIDSTWRSSGRSNRNSGGGKIALFGFAMVAVGGIGLIFGRLIKSGVSRQREFLADASAVQFTRNPSGIAGALRRIGGFERGSKLRSPKAEEASHMFFGEALNPALMNRWMATHPPLPERIRRITGLKLEGVPVTTTAPNRSVAAAGAMGFEGGVMTNPPSPSTEPLAPSSTSTAPLPQRSDQFMAAVGTATPQHLAKARAFLEALPTALTTAIQTPEGAMALVYGMLLDQDPAVRSRQLALLAEPPCPVKPPQVEALSTQLQQMDERVYLPLLDLSIPILRTMTAPQCAHFFKQIQGLVRADDKLSLSEYVLQLILQKRLRPHFQKELEQPKAVTNIDTVWVDCEVLLTILAKIGHTHAQDAVYALRSGLGRLPGAKHHDLPSALPKVTLNDFGRSLKRLEAVVPKLKQGIVDAAAHTVMVDNDVTLKEAELLRAIVITLDCPIPPFIEAPAQRVRRQPASTTARTVSQPLPRGGDKMPE